MSTDEPKELVRPYEFSVYPECDAGVYSHRDCTVAFYTRVGALLRDDMVLLNLGAGRGANITQDYSPFRRRIQRFKGRVSRVIGIDVDDAVLENPDLDEAHVVPIGDTYPIADSSLDLIICDHVLEHVTDADSFAREVARVLKPGGWFCARTPTKWGYVGLGARAIPNTLHTSLLSSLQPQRKAEDVFPTAYKLNTHGSLARFFPKEEWQHCSYGYNGVPSYHGNRRLLFRLVELWCWLMPAPLSAKLHVFLRKR
ncbi:class I SAM-dependent methyltransferase [Pyruvatibacter sp.]|uniref:class I SAM-dependent methyltransferase n=1 Tax=Pyruvatibacter sp. TaxID=1981328 RepID=UPI003265EC34